MTHVLALLACSSCVTRSRPEVDPALLRLVRRVCHLCLVIWCSNRTERTSEIAWGGRVSPWLIKKSLRA